MKTYTLIALFNDSSEWLVATEISNGVISGKPYDFTAAPELIELPDIPDEVIGLSVMHRNAPMEIEFDGVIESSAMAEWLNECDYRHLGRAVDPNARYRILSAIAWIEPADEAR